MAFHFEEQMIHDYHAKGFTIFRGAIPDALLRDLRREADKARALALELSGPTAQRIQPISKFADRIDQRPFKDYCELPALADAVKQLLGPDYTHGHVDIMGILVEPKERPWTIGWHRDGVVEVPEDAYDEIVRAKIAEAWYDFRHFNQVNCALYAESNTWIVPGSHLRQRDLPGERQSALDRAFAQKVAAASVEEAERICLEHCETFPGAVQMHLEAGDYMIYRNLAWHNGNYLPYHPRATIHDAVCYHGPGSDWGGSWWQAKKDAVARLEARTAGDPSYEIPEDYRRLRSKA